MEKILVTIPKGHIRDTFLPPDTAARLETLGEVIWNDSERQLTEKELEEKIPDVTVLVTGWGTPGLSEAVLQKADALKIVAHTGGTVAKLTPFSVFERGIRVLSGNDIYAESVAESVIAYALTALRDIPKYQDQLLKDGWSHPDWYNEGLLDQPVGLVGFGAVARHTVKLLKPFRNPIKVWADFLTPADEEAWGIKKVTAEEVFSTSKIVSIHTSLTDETFHSINSRLLKLLPDGALFLNTARGSIVDEKALAEELKTGRIKAVLDVYETEPLPMDSPLRGLPNVTLIPHMGGPTIDRRKAVSDCLIDEIRRIAEGKEPLRLEISKEAAARMTR